MGERGTAYPPPVAGGGYALRGVVVVEDLASLTGPTAGRWQLPRHLDASLRPVYDFADNAQLPLAYQTVLEEACRPDDLVLWLDAGTLLALWPFLYLPRVLRQAWEARRPVLGSPAACRLTRARVNTG